MSKNSVSSPCEPQSNDNTGLFSLPAPDWYLAKGVNTENLLQLFRHTNPVGRHQYCLGCKSSKQGEVALAPAHLLRRRLGWRAALTKPGILHPTRPQSNRRQSGDLTDWPPQLVSTKGKAIVHRNIFFSSFAVIWWKAILYYSLHSEYGL